MAGIGAAAITAEKVEEILDELVKQGKITTDEAKKTAEKIIKEGRKDFEEVKDDLNSGYEDTLKKLHLVTQEQFSKLEARVKSLEEKFKSSETPPASE